MDTSIIIKALKAYGEEAQLDKSVEELAELIVAIQKFNQDAKADNTSTKTIMSRVNDVIDEIADVHIMIAQLRIVFGEKDVDKRINFKLRRLEKRVDENLEEINPNQTEMFK